MKLADSVKPISYFKAHASEVISEVAETRKPFVVTQRGEAKVVLQDIRTYEETQDALTLLKVFALGQKDKEEGRVQSLEDGFSDIYTQIGEK